MQTLLILGDWSDDGHGKTQTITVDHNLADAKSLKAAFVAGEKILGINFEEIAEGYEEPWIPEDILEVLIAHKLLEEVATNSNGEPLDGRHWKLVPKTAFSGVDYAYEYDEKVNINPELYAALYMAIAQLGKPSLEFTAPKNSYDNRINIGGYGLFQ